MLHGFLCNVTSGYASNDPSKATRDVPSAVTLNVLLRLNGSVFHAEVCFGGHGAEEAGVDNSGDALKLSVYFRPLGCRLDVEVPIEEEIPVVGYHRTSFVHGHTKGGVATKPRFWIGGGGGGGEELKSVTSYNRTCFV